MKPIIPFISKLSHKAKQRWIEKIKQKVPEERIVLLEELTLAELDNVEIAIVSNPDLQLLRGLKSLKWIHTLGAGIEGVIDIAKERHFNIVRMIDSNLSNTMAEAVLAWTLFIKNKIPTYLLQQKNKHWKQQGYKAANDCNVGILGLGEMGKTSAKKLKENSFQVLGWSRTKKLIEGIQTFHGEDELDKFIHQCDILVCLLPQTRETQGIINLKLIKQLPKGSSIINFSRGGMLVTEDLVTMLDEQHIYHAVLDVFDKEPLPIDNDLWSHNKITILPHIAAITAPDTASVIVANNIKSFRSNDKSIQFVDLNKGY